METLQKVSFTRLVFSSRRIDVAFCRLPTFCLSTKFLKATLLSINVASFEHNKEIKSLI